MGGSLSYGFSLFLRVLIMKVIKIMLLMASFFAIAGAAVFQLFVLMTNKLSAPQDSSRHTFRAS
jgi:hypothetical protein